MYEDEHLEAAYEDRFGFDDVPEMDVDLSDDLEDDYDRDLTDEEMEEEAERDRDHLLEQQELEDFEQADEYFGHYGDDGDGW